jgi:hypothetical protein
VTASEFAFLALGLLLGIAAGAAIVEVARARPPARREVRITVAPNSIPARRASTLAESGSTADSFGPARGGPGDRRWVDRDPADAEGGTQGGGRLAGGEAGNRTPVRSAPPAMAGFQLATAAAAAGPFAAGIGGGSEGRPSVGIAVSGGPDPLMSAFHASAGREPATSDELSLGSATQATASSAATGPGTTAVATLQRPAASADPAGATSAEADTGGGSPSAAANGACAEERRMADERCAVATRAREGAREAVEALRAAQRTYDEHLSRAESEAAAADPRTVRAAKESAQLAFRQARSSATSRDAVETAARDWLTEINRINQVTREAAVQAERHRVAAADLAAGLERMSVETDAARISAEMAAEACVTAREAVAACEESAAMVEAGVRAATAPAQADASDGATREEEPFDPTTPMASRAGEDAAIIRLLRGDREVLSRIVATLGGGNEAEQRRWQRSIGDLLEAIVARAIEASALDFPPEHPFWGPFTRSQCRDITAALSSLGFRHDGFGGWVEDHMPSQRDLSLAVGYAGLDPMRIRHWPADQEMQDLMRNVTVAADEYVWEAAGALTLGELVSLLGRRADGLTELWNDWGTVRPLLLSGD